MQKVKKIILLVINILLLNCLVINCYATNIEVTKENLNESLQKFVASKENENNYKITVSDNVITIVDEGKTYNLNYNLTGNPTFTFEIPIEQGMSYASYKEQTDKLFLPITGYIAIANIQGVDFSDAGTYIAMSSLGNILNGSLTNENQYIIYDDINISDGVIIDKDPNDTKIIYASDFGERVMQYVNSVYKDKQIINDSSTGVNSYELTTERKDVKETSCKLVSSLSVNLDADFSELKGYNDKVNESIINKNITKENADYSIDLKVGQKCRIETTDEIVGYELSGSGYEYNEINKNCVEITGESVGKANGYIYIGETKKSIFITVEENTEGTSLDTITLKINTASVTDKSDENNNIQKEKTTGDNTISETILPKAGINNIVCLVIISSFILIIIFSIKLKKYKDIK